FHNYASYIAHFPQSSYTASLHFLFFNAPSPTEIYTLSLHDALPILLSDSVAFGQGGFSFSTTTPNIAYHIPGTGTKLYRTILSGDRKSTRLNSSHGSISYAVFCLKKKKKRKQHIRCS